MNLFENVPWNQGSQYSVVWAILVCILVLGIFLNFVHLVLHARISEFREMTHFPVIVAIALEDLSFNVLCLITCAGSLHLRSYFGESAMCYWQAFYAEFLMVLSGLNVCSLIYVSYTTIVHGSEPSFSDSLKTQFLLISYSFMLSFLGVFYPGKPSLNTAGLFCYTASQHPIEAIVFFGGYAFPVFAGLYYFNTKMTTTLKKMKLILHSLQSRKAAIQQHSQKIVAKERCNIENEQKDEKDEKDKKDEKDEKKNPPKEKDILSFEKEKEEKENPKAEIEYELILNSEFSSPNSTEICDLRTFSIRCFSPSARSAQVRILMGMWCYVLVMTVCYVPIFGVALYSWITQAYAPAWIWIFFGLTGHLNTITNPLLFYACNPYARQLAVGFFEGLFKTGPKRPEGNEFNYVNSYRNYFRASSFLLREAIFQDAKECYCEEIAEFFFVDYEEWRESYKNAFETTSFLSSADRKKQLSRSRENNNVSFAVDKKTLVPNKKSLQKDEIDSTPSVSLTTNESLSEVFLESPEELNGLEDFLSQTHILYHKYFSPCAPYFINLSENLTKDIQKGFDLSRSGEKVFATFSSSFRRMQKQCQKEKKKVVVGTKENENTDSEDQAQDEIPKQMFRLLQEARQEAEDMLFGGSFQRVIRKANIQEEFKMFQQQTTSFLT